jgi:predicted O-methyltransferase YrrM
MLRRTLRSIPPIRNTYRALRDLARHDELVMALHRKIFERGRLKLPEIRPEMLNPENVSVELPMYHPLSAGEDTPLNDLVFVLSVAKVRKSRRILEVGTYRARSALALHLNCPDAKIVSFDIQVLRSPYREALNGISNIELRHASFSDSVDILKAEPRFDMIFIDGAHDIDSVCDDSRLAFEILAPDGIIIWHDYRRSGYFTRELMVPEALELIRGDRRLFHVQGTTCAVYCPTLVIQPSLQKPNG